MKGMPLYVKILIGLIFGAIWSFISSAMGWNQFTIDWIDPFGQIFIRLLKFIAVPLVLFSVVTGIAGLNDVSKLGRMGGKTLLMYLITTVCAVSIGLLIGNVVKPGTFIDQEQRIKNRINYEYWATNNGVEILDGKYYSSDPKYATLVNEVEQKHGDELSVEDRKNIEEKLKVVSKNETRGPLYFLVDMVPENIVLSISDNKLMLQVIFFAIFLGITLIMIPSEKAQPIISFFEGMSEVFLKMVDLIMKAAPIFVFALMAGVIAKMADTPAEVFEIFKSLGAYSIAVFVGLAFMVAVFYPLIVKFVAKIGYSDFFRKISPAQFLAFSTSSSPTKQHNNIKQSERCASPPCIRG